MCYTVCRNQGGIGFCVFDSFVFSNTDIIIPDGVEIIRSWAFYGSNITSVSIPRSVTDILIGTFRDCDDLREIRYEGTISQWKNDIAFIMMKTMRKQFILFRTESQ